MPSPRLAPWLRSHGATVRLTACLLSVTLATVFVGLAPEANLIWVANGVLLAFLLLAPRRRWLSYLGVGFAAQLSGSMLVNPHWRMDLFLTTLNLGEVIISAFLLRWGSTKSPRFTDRSYLIRFIGFAVLTGPVMIGSVYALVAGAWLHTSPEYGFFQWIAADGLGVAVATPACVAILRIRHTTTARIRRNWIYLVLVAAAAVLTFCQTQVPAVFVIYPLLILVLLRLGLGWAAVATLFVAAVGSWFTPRGQGPFALNVSLSPLEPSILLQLFLACATFMLYSVSVVLESRRSIERRLEKIASMHGLVTENSRDIILLADFDGIPRYVSPAIHAVTGWTPDEAMELGFASMVHAEDRPKVEVLIRGLSEDAETGTIEYRVRKQGGGFVWVEACFRMIRDTATGLPTGILNIIRDVSARKLTEESRAFHDSLIRAIHDVSLDGILVVNNEAKVVSYNNRFLDVWQISRPNGAPGLNANIVNSPDELLLIQVAARVSDREGFLKRVRELYADPDLNDQCEIPLTDGRTLERYSTRLRSEEGQYLGRVWFFREITERKSAENRIQEAYRAVEALAATDALTGLANRRHFDTVLNGEWRRGIREQRPLSLLMIDADLFKAYNDEYGHLRGDNCLKQIAECVRDVIARPGDLVARLGGEEFVVILPATEAAGALQLSEEICEAIRKRRLLHTASPIGIVTVSVGCATMVPEFGRHAVNLLESADTALYEAKRKGRNQVCKSDSMKDDPAKSSERDRTASITGGSA